LLTCVNAHAAAFGRKDRLEKSEEVRHVCK
jgi:hypothetical protein